MIFRILTIVFLFSTTFCFSQIQRETYLKGNALLAGISVVNIGIEHQLNEKKTLEFDVLYSPWKSVNGNHAQALIVTGEVRHYFDQSFNKWYIGGNIGGSTFNLTKWNYWNSGKYQKGFNYMIGATIGYQFQWKEKWTFDAHIGGGTTQSFYKGYIEKNGETIRYDGAEKYNKSGEFTLYKFGIMIGYKL